MLEMICRGNIVLVLDTNIFLDILQEHDSGDILTSLRDWLVKTVVGAQCLLPRRSITLALSQRVVKEYKTGMGKRHLDAGLPAGLDLLAQSTGHMFPLTIPNGVCYLLPWRLQDDIVMRFPKKLRREDRKIMTLALKAGRTFLDRKLLIGCRDYRAYTCLRDALVREPVLITDSVQALSQKIFDP